MNLLLNIAFESNGEGISDGSESSSSPSRSLLDKKIVDSILKPLRRKEKEREVKDYFDRCIKSLVMKNSDVEKID